MDITLKLSRDFERCLDDLKRKYGEAFEYLNGLHPSQLDFSEFIDKFVEKDTMADTSVDPNANANHKDIRSFMTEKAKSEDKLFGLNKIFTTITKQWGLRTAKEWLEQEFSRGLYLNDSTTASYFPYCWANDLTRLATEGLFFLENYNNQGPKHLTTYFDDVIEFVSFLSNRQSGAVGLPNVLIWAWYFWKKDVETGYYMKDPDYYAKQQFQKFIYRLNQPFLRIDQSAFTNVSIFDRPYLESLFGGVEFPDGTLAIDHIEDLISFQKVFMKVVSDIREENMFTFPVLTFSLYYKDGKFQDEEFARWASNHNIRWSDSNFFVSDNIGILSNCPMSADTKILYWSEYRKEFKSSSIKDLYSNMKKSGIETVKVISNGELIECKVNKFEEFPNWEIELVNGVKLQTTGGHLNKVLHKDSYVRTDSLKAEDYLPFSLTPYEKAKNMTYEEGYLVGMFLGDGSFLDREDGIVLSLNKESKAKQVAWVYDYCPTHYDAKVKEYPCQSEISGKTSCVNVTIRSKYIYGLIRQFVNGDSALNKAINLRVINCSLDFRRGILDGLYDTDGGNSNRIYTSSESLKESLCTMLSTMGICYTFDEDNREGRLGTNPCYTIRYYTPGIRTRLVDRYVIEDGYMWFKVKSVKQIATQKSTSYCLEVTDDSTEPVFMLSSGLYTHNCRLLSDTSKLDAFINSIGGTALSVGSCRVSTINLVRIAYESGFDQEKYLDILRNRVLLDCKALSSMRHIIKRNIEKGLLPNYQDGAVELDKQFLTVGALGNFEVMDLFGLINEDELGYKSYSDAAVSFTNKILDTINDVKDHFPCDFSFNLEMIPAENCAGVICAADNLLFEQNKYSIYSNQWEPLTAKCTIQEKCRLGSLFDKKCGGGCIAHIDIENRFPNEEAAWDMLNYVASQGVIYFAFTTKISVCEDKHAFIGTTTCPVCGKPVADTYARVVGFYTPVSSYQEIRKQEFSQRKWYNVLNKNEVM